MWAAFFARPQSFYSKSDSHQLSKNTEFEDIPSEQEVLIDPREEHLNSSQASMMSNSSYDIVSVPSASPPPQPWNQILTYKVAEAGQYLSKFKFRGF